MFLRISASDVGELARFIENSGKEVSDFFTGKVLSPTVEKWKDLQKYLGISKEVQLLYKKTGLSDEKVVTFALILGGVAATAGIARLIYFIRSPAIINDTSMDVIFNLSPLPVLFTDSNNFVLPSTKEKPYITVEYVEHDYPTEYNPPEITDQSSYYYDQSSHNYDQSSSRKSFPVIPIIGELVMTEKTIGDTINMQGNNNVLVNHSTIEESFNKVKEQYDIETAQALFHVEDKINKAGNKEAAELFESFNEELSKSNPKKSSLKVFWDGTLKALPQLGEMVDVVAKITQLII